MTVSQVTASAVDTTSEANPVERYGLPTRLFVVLSVIVSAGFLILHFFLEGLRAGTISIGQWEEGLYSGVYWQLVALDFSLLVLSALLVSLSLALVVVRGLMYHLPCKRYCHCLLIHAVPWAYFTFSVVAF